MAESGTPPPPPPPKMSMSTGEGEGEAWRAMTAKYGEAEARRLLVAKLRAFADQIERGGFPDVFGAHVEWPGDAPCDLAEEGDVGGFGRLLERVSVTLSHPWPG